jgi:hypothetical protein
MIPQEKIQQPTVGNLLLKGRRYGGHIKTGVTDMNLLNRRNLQKAIDAIGLKAEISGGGRHIEIELADDQDFDVFRDQIANWGGFSCAYGGWVLRPGYKAPTDFDFNNVASHHHW